MKFCQSDFLCPHIPNSTPFNNQESQCVSIYFPLFILSLSVCTSFRVVSTNWGDDEGNTRLVTGCYPPSAEEVDISNSSFGCKRAFFFGLVESYKSSMYVITRNDIGWLGTKQLVCERQQSLLSPSKCSHELHKHRRVRVNHFWVCTKSISFRARALQLLSK